jgi:hypothetical protein
MIEQFQIPPASRKDCIFARTTLTFSGGFEDPDHILSVWRHP